MRMSITRCLLCCTAAVALLAAGCTETTSSGPDMAAPACTVVPQASNDILNACTVDTRETVMLVPAYPTNYPKGMPPTLIPPP
jgi:hypothetical protein